MPRGRPVSRTLSADPQLLMEVQGVFGTSTHGYRALALEGRLGFPTWKRWWQNKTVSRETHDAVRRAWERWTAAFVARSGVSLAP